MPGNKMQKTHVGPALESWRAIHASNRTTQISGPGDIQEISAQWNVESMNGGIQGFKISRVITAKGMINVVKSSKQR